MTNEEAKRVLKSTSINLGRRNGKTAYAEALSMAIKALEQDPCPNTISRQAAIDVLREYKTEPNISDDESEIKGYNDGIDLAISVLSTLPSAQPERKRGKWIRITQGAIPEKYMCPFCHRIIEEDGIESLISMRYPFCHCGADMRGEQE